MEILKEYGIDYKQAVTLNQHAIKAVERSYAPYSKFYVGAAILCGSGKIIEGVNVENASYGDTVCAERTAVFRLVAEGEKEIRAISVHIKAQNYELYPVPCGMCRQVLAEFGFFPVIMCKSPTSFIVKSVSSLLPYSFRSLELVEKHFAPNPKKLDEIIEAAEYWVQLDPDARTRAEAETWLVHDEYAMMRQHLTKRIDFGTAGLRGEMGAGYDRMNHLVVQQTAQVLKVVTGVGTGTVLA